MVLDGAELANYIPFLVSIDNLPRILKNLVKRNGLHLTFSVKSLLHPGLHNTPRLNQNLHYEIE